MTTVHIENTVQDFDTWKVNFDKYERFRSEQGVQSYRVSRSVTEPNEVLIDLEGLRELAGAGVLAQARTDHEKPAGPNAAGAALIPTAIRRVTERVPSAAGESSALRPARLMHRKGLRPLADGSGHNADRSTAPIAAAQWGGSELPAGRSELGRACDDLGFVGLKLIFLIVTPGRVAAGLVAARGVVEGRRDTDPSPSARGRPARAASRACGQAEHGPTGPGWPCSRHAAHRAPCRDAAVHSCHDLALAP